MMVYVMYSLALVTSTIVGGQEALTSYKAW